MGPARNCGDTGRPGCVGRSVTLLLPPGVDSCRQQLPGGCLHQSRLPSLLPVLLTSSNTPSPHPRIWSVFFLRIKFPSMHFLPKNGDQVSIMIYVCIITLNKYSHALGHVRARGPRKDKTYIDSKNRLLCLTLPRHPPGAPGPQSWPLLPMSPAQPPLEDNGGPVAPLARRGK